MTAIATCRSGTQNGCLTDGYKRGFCLERREDLGSSHVAEVTSYRLPATAWVRHCQ